MEKIKHGFKKPHFQYFLDSMDGLLDEVIKRD
jgi:hypothetical protein